jgi:hypothetical protein
MKKIFAFFVAVALVVSCAKRDHEATITYRVYYPGNTVTRTYTMDSTDEPSYILGSDRGSNYLYVSDGRFFGKSPKLEDTSAPIEIVSFRVRKK